MKIIEGEGHIGLVLTDQEALHLLAAVGQSTNRGLSELLKRYNVVYDSTLGDTLYVGLKNCPSVARYKK